MAIIFQIPDDLLVIASFLFFSFFSALFFFFFSQTVYEADIPETKLWHENWDSNSHYSQRSVNSKAAHNSLFTFCTECFDNYKDDDIQG